MLVLAFVYMLVCVKGESVEELKDGVLVTNGMRCMIAITQALLVTI